MINENNAEIIMNECDEKKVIAIFTLFPLASKTALPCSTYETFPISSYNSRLFCLLEVCLHSTYPPRKKPLYSVKLKSYSFGLIPFTVQCISSPSSHNLIEDMIFAQNLPSPSFLHFQLNLQNLL